MKAKTVLWVTLILVGGWYGLKSIHLPQQSEQSDQVQVNEQRTTCDQSGCKTYTRTEP